MDHTINNAKTNRFIATAQATLLAAACLLMFAMPVMADEEVPGAPQKKPILLTGGTIHPISSAPIENGEILFENGKITAIGKSVKKPKGTKTLDLKGKHVFPGMIESHSHMGLTEIAAVRATNDFSETGEVNPNVKALVSVNPDNVIIPVTRANGVLFALTAPSGGLISGKSAVIQLDGWTYEDLAIKSETALHITWPSQTLSSRRRCLLYTSPSPRDRTRSRMPSSA